MPAHNHSASTNTTGEHNHTLTLNRYAGEDYSNVTGWGSDPVNQGPSTQTTTTVGNHSHTITINNTGSNTPHNNLQPYAVTYIWKRVN